MAAITRTVARSRLRQGWAASPIRFSVAGIRAASTLVLGEHEGGALKAASLSAVAAAAALEEGSKVSLLLAGSGPALHAAAVHASTSHPAISEVLVADSENLKHALAEPWADLLVQVQKKGGYSHLVAAASSTGKSIVPRAAALLEVSAISDVVRIVDHRTFVRPMYAGNALSTIRYKGSGPCLLTVRPTAFPAVSGLPLSGVAQAPIFPFDASQLHTDGIPGSEWVGQHLQPSDRPELGSAKVVISGGRGLKSAENFKMLETLADKLGGAVGASRAAVDAGFVPNDMQIGQTGRIVAPNLYIAIGVSGAIQHLAGIKDSKVIVAINKDADAPIFQVADYGLAADLFQVLPELIEKVPDKRSQ